MSETNQGLPTPSQLLPHRDIALCIDELVELEPGVRAVGLWTPDERYFKGHFPDMPILPGHWTIEAVNLAGACALLAEHPGITPLFREGEAKFSRPISLGDTIELVAEFGELKPGRMSTVEGNGYAMVDGKKVFTANLMKAVWTS